MQHLIDVVLLGLLMVTGFAIVRMRSLLAVAMLTSIYSLLSASLFVVLDAVDVALTEAAIGAGISTILMLATIGLAAPATLRLGAHAAVRDVCLGAVSRREFCECLGGCVWHAGYQRRYHRW